AEMFVTVWLGIMTISTGEIVYANAGHDDPAIYTDKGEFKLLKEKHGFVIGGMKGVAYKNNTVTLNKGDKIFLYTDGLPEATAKDGNMFKITGMMDALNKHKEDTPKAVIEGIWQNVSEFMDGENQFDDLTMLCLSYQGKEKNDAAKMDVPANEENLHAVLEFIEEQATERGLSLKAINQIKIAAEEIFVNICKYAYGTGTGETEISVYENEELLCVCFTDSGVEYNPLEKPDPDVKAKAEDRQIGGLGIYMAKKLTDGISYERKDGKNILIMEKRIWKN
ncbi:MAG: SpoIIE family protein phosphatase, partial [Clostridia bacterium]|nr:SpoIIE family protein phosphatase [Clostridia bacterium]